MPATPWPSDPTLYTASPWTDPNGKQWWWRASKSRWTPFPPAGGSGSGAVDSVNGMTGAVTITKTSIGLGSVENTALSTWTGSTNVATLGNVTSGTWNGTAIADGKIASAATWNAKQAALVSGTNIKTINGASILGSGNIAISGGDLTSGPVTSSAGVSAIADGAIAQAKVSGLVTALTNASNHAASTANPHSVTKAQVGLGSVENTALSTWTGTGTIATLGTISTGTWQGTIIAPAYLGTGTSIATKYLRGDGTWQTLSGGGDATTGSSLAQFAATTSAQLAGVISDETGTGALVFATSPTLVTPILGTPTSGNLVNCTFPALNQSTSGNAGTVTGLSVTGGKTLTVSNTLTLSGTDGAPLNIGAGGTLGSAAFTASTAYVSATADQTVSGVKTFSGNLYSSAIFYAGAISATGGITATGGIALPENAGIALDPAGSVDEKWSGITIAGTAGATLVVGDLIYLEPTVSKWWLTDADNAAGSGDVVLGLNLTSGATDGTAIKVLLMGTMRSADFPASLAVGAPLYVSTAAGQITATKPSGTDDVVRRIGFVLTAEPNTILFNPSNDYITAV